MRRDSLGLLFVAGCTCLGACFFSVAPLEPTPAAPGADAAADGPVVCPAPIQPRAPELLAGLPQTTPIDVVFDDLYYAVPQDGGASYTVVRAGERDAVNVAGSPRAIAVTRVVDPASRRVFALVARDTASSTVIPPSGRPVLVGAKLQPFLIATSEFAYGVISEAPDIGIWSISVNNDITKSVVPNVIPAAMVVGGSSLHYSDAAGVHDATGKLEWPGAADAIAADETSVYIATKRNGGSELVKVVITTGAESVLATGLPARPLLAASAGAVYFADADSGTVWLAGPSSKCAPQTVVVGASGMLKLWAGPTRLVVRRKDKVDVVKR